MGGGSGGILGIGSSKKMINSEKPNVKFDDMAGNKEAKEEVQEIVDFLKFSYNDAATTDIYTRSLTTLLRTLIIIFVTAR